ncbi:Fibronectin type III domain [Myroides odoratus]|nr:Fibronectin type III domain protein [Myroides odoratus DSM 2801]STZ31140.1 Fibronectin type III domain [Myroides odoratus]
MTIGLLQNVSAQVYPVQVVPTVISPYSSKLSDYSNAMVNRINLQLISTDVLMNRREVDLRVKIQGNGITAQSRVLLTGARPIYLNGGEIQSLSSSELATYFRYDNLEGISSTQYSNPLPDGVYTICFQVFDKLTQKVLSTSGCSTMYLMLNDPPLLNIPSNKEEISTSDFPLVIFSWTPRQLNATNVSYRFELKELLDPTMDPTFAFEVSRPLYAEDDLRMTTLVYDINKPNLLPGKRYAWRVRAISTSGLGENSVFKNNGYSEVYSFTYSSTCSAPRFLLSEQQANNRVKIMWQGENSQQRYHVQYRKAGIQDAAWFDLYTVNTQSMLSHLEPGFTYEFRVGASCQQASYGVEPSFTYSSIQTFYLEAKNNSTTYNCGIVPDLKVTNQQPLGGLVINETFMAGDFPVKVLEVDGSNGVFSGRGYIVVPYLFDTRIAVEFSNVAINADYQLMRGVVETTYDPNWENVEFIDNLVDTNQQEITLPFPIADLPEGIQIGPGGDLLIKGDDGRTETFPGGKDTVITDSTGQVYYIDKDGKVSGPTAVAEGGKPTLENTDGVNKNGEVQAFTAKGISVAFESDDAFDAVEYNQGLTSDYKKIGGNYLPFKAVVKGSSAKIRARVTLSDSQLPLDRLVFKTSTGTHIDAKRVANSNDFELTVNGMQSNAIEEVQASIKQGEQYKVAGAFKLVHLDTRTVELRLVPTSDQVNLEGVIAELQSIYAQVGVTVQATVQPVFSIDSYVEGTQVETADEKGDLSTYSTVQQRIITAYQGAQTLDKAYYIFVTEKGSSTNQQGYMRLNGQFGFVFRASDASTISRTIAHELGHGAFKLEHPFAAFKSKGLREGTTNSLMDYATTSTNFIFTDWRQINDPKLRLYAFQGQGDGEKVLNDYKLEDDSYFVTPAGELLYLTKGTSLSYLCENPNLNGFNGVVYGFTTADGKRYVNDINIQLNELNSSGGVFRGYYQVDPIDRTFIKDSQGNRVLYKNTQSPLKGGKQLVHFVHAIPEGTDVLYYILREEVTLTDDWISKTPDYSGSRYKERKYNAQGEYVTIVVSTGCDDYDVFVENISIQDKITLEVFKNKKTGKYQVHVALLGKARDKKYEGDKTEIENQLKAIAEEKLNELNGLDGVKSPSSSLGVFDVEGEDAGEFYVAEMDGRQWLKTIGDLGSSVWETANLPEAYWNKDSGYATSSIHVPPIFAGVSNGLTEEALGLQQLVKLGYDVVSKEEVRIGIWEGLTNITFNSVIDAGDEAIRNRVNQYANHVEKPYIAQHALGRDAIQAVTTAVGIGVITKSGKLADEVADIGKQVKKEARKKATKEFLKEFDPTFIEKLKKIPNYDKLEAALIESWKKHHGSKFSLQYIYDNDLVDKIKGFELKVHADGNFTADMVLKGGLGKVDKFVEFKSWKTGSFSLLNGSQYKNQLKAYMQSGNFEQIFDAQKLIKDGVTNPDKFVKEKIVDMIKKNPEDFKSFFPNELIDINQLDINSAIIQNFTAK